MYAEGNLDIRTMLSAVFDDSSDPKKERFCAAGGLFTADTIWERFEVEWRHATRDLRGPFHAMMSLRSRVQVLKGNALVHQQTEAGRHRVTWPASFYRKQRGAWQHDPH